MRRLAVAALVAGAAIGFAPSPVRAEAGGAMTAVNGVFTGTSGDDLLVIGRDAEVLTHNRFAAGDPGFASATDFDSTVDGVQTKSVSLDTIGFDGGPGGDTVRFVGALPNAGLSTLSFGDGQDTLDFSNLTVPALMGPPDNPDAEGTTDATLERIDGSLQNDRLLGSSSPSAVGMIINGGPGDDVLRGTAASDTLDGGAGLNEMNGRGGPDNLFVRGPLAASMPHLDGGDGADYLSYTGTDGPDDLEITAEFGGVSIRNAANGDGFGASVEQLFVGLLSGNDSVFVTPPEFALIVSGGGGTDEVVVDAQRTTVARFDHTEGVRQIRMANPFDGHVDLVAVQDDVESARVLNETLLATAPGPGGGPHVRTFRADGTPVAGFFAYQPDFHSGVSVALGDVDGDLDDEIITGAGPGGGPHVRVFRSDGTDTGVGFMAYANFTGGVNVAAVDVDGDGVDEIVTTPATGGGPHVRVWSGGGQLIDEWMAEDFKNTGLQVARGTRVNADCCENTLITNASGLPTLAKVFAPDGSPGVTHNVVVPYGDDYGGGATVSGGRLVRIDANPLQLRDLLIAGAGPGGGPHVRVFEFRDDTQQGGFADLGGFYAYEPGFHGGVSVTACNPDGLSDEIVTGAGPGGGPHVRMFSLVGAARPLSFMAYDNFNGGVRVACGGAETAAY